MWVACANAASIRHGAAVLSAVVEVSWHEELEAPRPARRALAPLPANCLVVHVCAHILSAGPDICEARTSTDDQLAQLFYYLKEVRETWCLRQIHYGAPLLPRASPVACA